MSKVIIIVNAEVKRGRISANAPVTERMVLALSKCIIDSHQSHEIEIISGADLWSKSIYLSESSPDLIYCPLTIKLPDWFRFPAQGVYDACRDLESRRRWVKQRFGYQTSQDNSYLGDLWLPVILTDKELIYGSVISEGMIPNDYQQPYDLPLDVYPKLKQLASDLLNSIDAIPSVYLVQFRLLGHDIIFDRLWPFPATPAVASINVQQPDLYACHWLCLSNQPLPQPQINYPAINLTPRDN